MATKITKRGALIDQLGNLKEQIAMLEKQERAIVEQLNKQEGTFEGLYFKVSVYHVAPMILDKDRVKALLGEETYNSCLNPGKEHNCVRCTRI